MIALEHLHVIHVIQQEGSFRKASERLFKARSAVSYSVKQVEDYYGIEVFSRDTYRPQLTRDGGLLLNKIRQLLHQADEFDQFARQINAETESELRIGISAVFPTEKVTALLHQLKQEFPHTIVRLNIEVASGERMLLDDIVDLGIYGALEHNPDVDYKQIEHCRLPLFISKQFPLAKKLQDLSIKTIRQQDLLAYPQVVVTSSYKSSPDTGIAKGGQHWYVSDHHTKKALILDGLCWGRISEYEAAPEADKLIPILPGDTMELPLYIARRKNKAYGPVANRVWGFFAEYN